MKSQILQFKKSLFPQGVEDSSGQSSWRRSGTLMPWSVRSAVEIMKAASLQKSSPSLSSLLRSVASWSGRVCVDAVV